MKLNFEETKAYFESCNSMKQTAEHFDVNVSSVQRLFKRNEYQKEEFVPPDKETLSRMYEECGNAKDVGKIIGRSEPFVLDLIRSYGIPVKSRWNNDEDAIIRNYEELGSIEGVAERMGIGTKAVAAALKRAGINTARGVFNFELAKQLYASGKTLDEVAEAVGVCRPTITKKFKEAGIEVIYGGKREAKTSFSGLYKQVVISGLLGDGSLRVNQNQNKARFNLSCKHKEYLEYIQALIPETKSLLVHQWKENKRKPGIIRQIGHLEFPYSPELYHEHHRWYSGDSQYKDIFPDIALTPFIVLHWYIQDGYRSNNGRVVISTNSFKPEYVSTLVEKFNQLGIAAYQYYKDNNTSIIRIDSKEGHEAFFNYIGRESPVECYHYKFPDGFTGDSKMMVLPPTRQWEGSTCWQKITSIQDEYTGEEISLSAVKIKEMITDIDKDLAAEFIKKYEWLGTTGNTKFIYGAFYKDKLIGVTIFGIVSRDPVGQFCDNLYTQYDSGAVLTRGCSLPGYHKNLASFQTSQAVQLLSQDHKINIVVSFSDPQAGELGTIYQACNFNYCGKGNNTYALYHRVTGETKHSWNKEAKNNNFTSSSYEDHLSQQGWIKCRVPAKHKYVKVIGGWREDGTYSKWHKRHLQGLVDRFSKPYPKSRGK